MLYATFSRGWAAHPRETKTKRNPSLSTCKKDVIHFNVGVFFVREKKFWPLSICCYGSGFLFTKFHILLLCYAEARKGKEKWSIDELDEMTLNKVTLKQKKKYHTTLSIDRYVFLVFRFHLNHKTSITLPFYHFIDTYNCHHLHISNSFLSVPMTAIWYPDCLLYH